LKIKFETSLFFGQAKTMQKHVLEQRLKTFLGKFLKAVVMKDKLFFSFCLIRAIILKCKFTFNI